MKALLYSGLLFFLVPLQVTVVPSLTLWGISPDLCLVAACIVGFWFGPLVGGALGGALGFGLDTFSASGIWLNTVSKAAIGFLCGQLGKNLSRTTAGSIFLPILAFSFFLGVVFLVSSRRGLNLVDFFNGVPSIIFPQAILDGILGVTVNWAFGRGGLNESKI